MRRLFVILVIISTVTGAGFVFAGNQDEANNIAHQLGLKYPQQNIEVAYQDGKVRLRGEITSDAQRAEIMSFVKQMPKVNNVQESFVVAPKSATAPQAKLPVPGAPAPVAPAPVAPSPVAVTAAKPAQMSPAYTARLGQAPAGTPAVSAPKAPSVSAPTVVAPAVPAAANNVQFNIPQNGAAPQRPLGVVSGQQVMGGQVVNGQGYAQTPAAYQMPPQGQPMIPGQNGQPNLPTNAWPTYADYPNYGQVSYPKQYGAGAFPYVGPFYPYPQVPLGWRKVTMEWHDGYWWLDFNDGSQQGPFSPLFRQPTRYR